MNHLDCVLVSAPKARIEFLLSGYPEVSVFASQVEEDGIRIALEGEVGEVNEFITELVECGICTGE